MLEEDEILDQQRSLIFENELTDDNSGSESTGLLQSSRMPASCRFHWGQARFRFGD
jgi:hypothetical protein